MTEVSMGVQTFFDNYRRIAHCDKLVQPPLGVNFQPRTAGVVRRCNSSDGTLKKAKKSRTARAKRGGPVVGIRRAAAVSGSSTAATGVWEPAAGAR